MTLCRSETGEALVLAKCVLIGPLPPVERDHAEEPRHQPVYTSISYPATRRSSIDILIDPLFASSSNTCLFHCMFEPLPNKTSRSTYF